jgi:ribonuclease VapC
MFIDASAMVAILRREADGEQLSGRIERAPTRLTSPLAIVEAVMSLGKQKRLPPALAESEVRLLIERAGVAIRDIDDATGSLAIAAHARYGKGSGHPAHLNFGDCFAYAMAKRHGVPLLYKGDDFARTDLA